MCNILNVLCYSFGTENEKLKEKEEKQIKVNKLQKENSNQIEQD